MQKNCHKMSNQKHDEQHDRKFQNERNPEEMHKGLGNTDFRIGFNTDSSQKRRKLRVPPKTSPPTKFQLHVVQLFKFIWKQLGLDMQKWQKKHVAQVSSNFRHSGRADLAHNDLIQSWSKTYSNAVPFSVGKLQCDCGKACQANREVFDA